MGTTAEKLQAIVNSKSAIKTAINSKGGSITDSTPLDEYATAISNLPEDQLPSFLNGTITTITDSTLTTAPAYRFYGQSNLTSISFPNMINIYLNAFEGCSGLTGEVTSFFKPTFKPTIGSYAFKGCTGLTSVTYPTNMSITETKIYNYAFEGCTGITSFTYGMEGSTSGTYTPIKEGTFKGCTGLTTVYFKYKNTYFVASKPTIAAYAFQNCTSLTSLTLDTTGSSGQAANGFNLADVNVFDGITGPITVYVPSGKISTYQSATN